MYKALLNGTLFNISWLAIVSSQQLAISLGVVAIHLGLHAWLMKPVAREWLLIAGVTLLGLTLDQILFACGVFTIEGRMTLAPLWLGCLWPVLATTLGHAFAMLQNRPLLAALAGACGGTLSYLAGTRISMIDFASPLLGPVVMGTLWMLLMPLLAQLAGLLLENEVHDPVAA